MCGIWIIKAKEMNSTLENQIDRGLDGVGILSNNGRWFKCLRWNINDYKKLITKYIDKYLSSEEEMVMFHHRKASIGGVELDNGHPFLGTHFDLMQNGTSRKFYNKCKNWTFLDVDGKPLPAPWTDSEMLLRWIETETSCLADVPDLLDGLSKELYGETFGCIMMRDRYGNILFYTDGARETNIELSEDGKKVIRITNYPQDGVVGWKNVWSIFLDFEGNVLKNNFKEVNKTSFYVKKTYTKTTTSFKPTVNTYSYTSPWYKASGADSQARIHWSDWNNEIGKYVKRKENFNSDDQTEYDNACDFFFWNYEAIKWKPYHIAEEEYFKKNYGVRNNTEFFMAFKANCSLYWIRLAYIEVIEAMKELEKEVGEDDIVETCNALINQQEMDIDSLHNSKVG